MPAKVPAILVDALREFLRGAGVNPVVVSSDGTVDLFGLAGEVLHEVEFRSNVTPPIVLRLRSTTPGAPPTITARREGGKPGVGEKVARHVKPWVRLSGLFGERVIAPYGRPTPGAWRRALSIAGAAAVAVPGALFVGGTVIGAFLRGRRCPPTRASS